MTELAIVAVLTVRKGTEQELRSALAALVAPSRKEQGNLEYEMYVDRNEPWRFVVVERWTDEAAHAKHDAESSHIRHWKKISEGKVEKVDFYKLENIG